MKSVTFLHGDDDDDETEGKIILGYAFFQTLLFIATFLSLSLKMHPKALSFSVIAVVVVLENGYIFPCAAFVLFIHRIAAQCNPFSPKTLYKLFYRFRFVFTLLQ